MGAYDTPSIIRQKFSNVLNQSKINWNHDYRHLCHIQQFILNLLKITTNWSVCVCIKMVVNNIFFVEIIHFDGGEGITLAPRMPLNILGTRVVFPDCRTGRWKPVKSHRRKSGEPARRTGGEKRADRRRRRTGDAHAPGADCTCAIGRRYDPLAGRPGAAAA